MGESQEVLELLMSASERQALGMLRILRKHGDPAVALLAFKSLGAENSSALPLEETEALEQTSGLELELMATCPMSYPSLMLLTSSALEAPNLLRPFSVREIKSFEQRYFFLEAIAGSGAFRLTLQ